MREAPSASSSNQPIRVAVAGLGRMGAVHALHLHELERDTGSCELVAVADVNEDSARRFCASIEQNVPIFSSVAELAESRLADAVVIVTPTDKHREHAGTLIASGHRVLLEKPLTATLEGDREFGAELDRNHPNALMLGFQRRFDEPLLYAKQLIDRGVIGRVFKIHSALEDSNPAPNGYRSGGILPDMSVHNVDEILWLTGRTPSAALSIGSRIFSHALTTCEEDFDDALLYLWFEGDLVAQIQVSRNHVSGYRVETVIFGEQGQIQVGRFDQKPFEVSVRAYGRRGCPEPLASRQFPLRNYGRPLPEFVDRFGPAYKAELTTFIECCRTDAPFPTSHRDGIRAQEVISAGMRAMIGSEQAADMCPLGR
jgi:myo-inositol 2-dehydrogenase / D-chiro-inositol 1-dehydrogenase